MLAKISFIVNSDHGDSISTMAKTTYGHSLLPQCNLIDPIKSSQEILSTMYHTWTYRQSC